MSGLSFVPLVIVLATEGVTPVLRRPTYFDQSRPSSDREPRCWKEGNETKNADGQKRQAPPLPERFNGAKVRRTAIVLKLCIDSTGRVTDTIPLVSSGNKEVDAFYRHALSQWTFKPPIKNGQPMVSVSTIAVSWNTK
jgi:TonB family protein